MLHLRIIAKIIYFSSRGNMTSLQQDSMVWVEALIPFEKGELLSTVHQVGMVERTVSNHIIPI